MAEPVPGDTALRVVESDRAAREASEAGARKAGTPFLSFFSAEEAVSPALQCGFRAARQVTSAELFELSFTNRSDNLRPSSSEALLVASL
ncbi:MAG: hypothetical protein SFV17_16960 [Candidatus Obscuribacter sp.]|nr:hypothetical protein [Candidatus Obscuribacter sp.]